MNTLLKMAMLLLLSINLLACEMSKNTKSTALTGPSDPRQASQNDTKTEIDTITEPELNIIAASPTSQAIQNRGRLEEQRISTGRLSMIESQPGSSVVASKEKKHIQAHSLSRFANDSHGVPPDVRVAVEPYDRENYAHLDNNPVLRVTEHPVSTFSIDVDTGSYSNIRRMLREGRLPVHDAIRVEEMVNYFSYQYPIPTTRDIPFSVSTEIAPSPWAQNRYLLRIGIKGYEVPKHELKSANLVFLIDVSGSMRSPNKLDLLKKSLIMLTQQLSADDRVSIVVYAGASGVVLEPTSGSEKASIINALERLQAGGSTNGGAGIRLAYRMAEQSFIKDGINRILLATDGDFNVGTTNFESLKSLVETKRKTGVTLTTLGFGAGNYNDHLAEQLADHGNGANYYIDSLQEARKVLIDQMSSTMQTIAADTKIQIEFNPATVSEYRLIGYENRTLRREDFNNDKVDAGDIGAGHTVTALYEITLSGDQGAIDPLRYGQFHKKGYGNVDSSSKDTAYKENKELAHLRLRYKKPGSSASILFEKPVYGQDIQTTIAKTSVDFRFAASVAAFGQLLKGGIFTGSFTYSDVLNLARSSRGPDPFGYRSEFIQLVSLASTLDSRKPGENSR